MPVLPEISYTANEAAYYARLHPATVRSWLKGRLEIGEGGATELNFQEFVQLLAVRELRARGISLAKIRETMRFIKSECGIDYPLASKDHRTFTEGKELYIQVGDEDAIFSATGRLSHQLNFKPIVELYMTQLEFNEQGLAEKYRPFQHDGETVTLAPAEYYGQPIIAGSSYTAFSLANAVECEGGIDAAAEVYGVDRTKITAALAYVDFLGQKPSSSKEAA